MSKDNFVPLSQTQLGIYLDCVRRGEGAYNGHFLYTLDNNIDMERLAAAIDKAVAAHPYMNVRIAERDGEPVQYIPDDIEPYHQDVKYMTEDEWQRELPRIMSEPLKLIDGRLFRLDLIQTESAKYLLRTTHHVFFDRTASNALFDDIAAAYNGLDLTHESYNAIDAARDEALKRGGSEYEAARKYYNDKFSGLDTESLPLPDTYGNKADSFESYEHEFNLNYDDMRSFCREHNISASALTSAAFGFTLGTYTHQREALFSTIYHGRKDERTANIIGMFVKTMPVYCSWGHDTRVADFLTGLTEQIQNSRDNDLFSFADLNRICPMNDKPMFAYHGMIKTTSTFCGLPCEEKILDKDTTGYQLGVELMAEPDGMKLHIEYNAGKYSRLFIENFASTYENVLNQFMSREYIRDIESADKEQLAVLDGFNDTGNPYDDTQTIVSLFRKAASENPDRTAVIFKDIKLTYKKLDDITERIAGYIADKGLGRGDVVSILIPRGEYMPIASIGALKSGCAYQPLDYTYPPERLNFMIKDSGAKLLITTEELRPLITDYSGDVLMLSEIASLPAANAELPEIKPEDLFILLYTSGSTGTPKGVRLTHGNLVCFVNWYHRYYNLQPDDCVGQYASYGFDACMMDICTSLTRGAALCIIPEEIRLDLNAINEYMERHHVTHQFMTTQIARQFAVNIKNYSLKALFCGGEKLVPLTPPAGYKFQNGYGPTECTCCVAVYHVKEYMENIPIGKANDNVKLYIVDSDGHRVPVGALGELWVSGQQVGDGYLNRPDKTVEAFIENPFNSDPNYNKVYKTGDIVRYKADGNIEFFGRRDGQVKIRGFRIELSEVEAVIRQFPDITDATVAAFDNESGEGKYLAAYVVSGDKIDIKALNEFIKSQKPPYMVPAVTMQIDKIPLNQNGKVNKRALPKPEFKDEENSENSGRSLDVLEKELCAITGKVIGAEKISLTTPLIYMGLDSIRSIQLSTQIYKRFKIEIQSTTLLNGATLEDINDAVLNGFMSGHAVPQSVEKIEIKEVPLSYPQMGVYFECVNHPNDTLYNIPSMFIFGAETDAQKLAVAVEAIVRAHPALTAHFETRDDNIVQVRGDNNIKAEIKAEILEMSEAELDEYKRNFVRPFDLSKAPLCRFAVVKTPEHVYLLSDFHHLVFDGASLNLFIKELAAALNDGRLPEPESYTYFDYVSDEKKFEQSPEFEENKKYFADMLSGFESASEIMADRSGREEEGRTDSVSLQFDLKAASDFCKSQNVTPAALFLAASFYALSRYANDNHVYLSTISSGRSDVRLADTFGMFVNTLPLGIEIKDVSSAEFLRQSADVFYGAIRHEKYPFARIAGDYGFEPNIMYGYQIGVVGEKGGLKREPLELEMPKFKIEIMIEERNGEPRVTVNYNNALYSEELMQNLARSIVIAAESIIAAPAKNIRDLSLLDGEQLAILDSFNNTEHPYDATQTIVSLFRKAASENAERTAVIFKDIKLTYQELDDITERIAGYIANKGLGVGDVVSILIPRDEYMPIASIGALKAGCAYQPLDPTYPPERLNFMIKDSNAKLLITTEELRPLITDYNGDVLLLSEIASLPVSNAKLPEVKPENLFILLYTSGSTGTPKGVRLTHGNIVCFVNWYHRYYNLHPEDCIGQYASFGFDACMMDMYSPLTRGAALCIIPEEIRLDLTAINEYLEKNHVTHQFMTTQVCRQFAVNVENKTLKHLLSGGEKLISLDPPTAYTLYNGYGPTECTIFTTTYPVTENEENIPIGKPLDNLKLYVVDGDGHRVPVGAMGELWIAGPQVGDGYLNQPERTAEAFIDNPFNSDPNYNKVYKTGDIVRYRADGNIEFFGRSDGQVKIRGFRIELSEVEAVIRQFPGITDATVAAFDSESGEGKYLAAYVVSGDKIDIKALKEFIKSQKPPYMVPAVTMQIDKIPLNQNSKVNKRALPKPEFKDEENSEDSGRPLNVMEQELCAITGKVIGTENISLTTPLSYMGLDSIRSIQLSTQIYKRFNIEIQSRRLLDGATLADVENDIWRSFMSGKREERTANPAEIKDAPLSYPQMGVYYDCMRRPSEMLYNMPSLFAFPKDIDVQKLSGAIKAIVKAHPALTAHFELKEGNVTQVRGSNEIKAEILEMSEQELDEYKKNFVRPFDLSKEPLCRFIIVKTENRVCLLTDFHHLVFDGTSLNLFIKELAAAINLNKLPELESYTYFDYAADEKIFEKSPEYEANKKYFAEMLSDFESASEITADLIGKEDEGGLSKAAAPFNFKAASEFCKSHNVTPAALFLAASFYAVSRYVNDNHVYLATISNGRSDVKTAETYGMFVNTLPLGVEIRDETAAEFLKRNADVFDGAIRHEKYPFARIANDYGFEPNIMYGYQIGVVEEEGGLKCEPLKLEMPKFKLEIMIEERNGEACVTVNYNNALYSEELMQSLARSIVIAAEGIMAAPAKNIRDLSLLDGEQLAILDSFNNTEHPYDATQTIVSLFRKAASENADRTAVIFKDIKLTYQELDDITERIAGYIADKGLGVGDVVSILIPRGEYMPITVIGVLKAGCAYQPLDSTYPPERLNFMLKDSGAKLLITTEELRPLITDYKGEVLILSEIASMPACSVKLPEVKPEDLFILLYTSGSTGTPKGVRLTHANLVCFINWYHRYFELQQDDCVGQYASYGFDACMMDICTSLTRGAALCIIPEEIRLDLNAINEYMERHHVTHQFMTTQVARQFAVNIKNYSLKALFCGGEKLVPLTPPTAYTLHNGYGPTESTCCVAVYHVKEYMENIPIGKANDNVKLYIVDSGGHRVPIGALGELWVSSPQVGDGYLNLPEKTAEVFIDNPFNSDPNYNKVYKTGDIVRYLPDGNIEFFGRSDGQVKIRGFRIELSEVEAVIRQFPGITDATVAAFDNKSGEGKYLAAYVVSDEKVDIKALNDFIKSKKPPYMVPAVTMQIDKIPLTQNGKVNKRALPKAVAAQSDYEAAANDVERAFCKIFCSILQLDDVGATEDFFSLGGTSILVTLLLIEAEKAGYRVTFQDVFSRPTPRMLAGLFIDETDVAAEPEHYDEIRDYDYSKLQPILDANTLDNFKAGVQQPLGDILLTGATGYLGVHTLHELLERYDGKVYCLLRGKSGYNAESRLKNQLFYYFENTYDDLLNKRLFVIDGDVTKPIDKLPVSTVINCAAVVKHFSAGTEIEDVNVGGVSNIIDYCLANNARLIQVSTISTVSMGMSDGEVLEEGRMIGERDLYFRQSLDNKYVHSKFLAERLILEAVAEKGLNAKIMRLGNLAARYSDGEFQINYSTNSAMGRLKIYALLGVCPYEQLDVPMEFSPIDEVAKAILILSQTPRECVLFHPYNHNTILSGNVFDEMGKLGLPVRPVERDDFDDEMRKAEEEPVKAKLLTSMLAYQNGSKHVEHIPQHNTYTMQVLYRMGYRWPVTSLDYVGKFIEAIKGLGFFEF